MEGLKKVAVVTGGNKGIGYGIVKGLCDKFNGIVYLTARDTDRGRKAVEEIKTLNLKVCPTFHQLDITDLDSIARFKAHIQNTHGGLDLLVNNAAIAFKNDATDPFSTQASVTIEVNYFGTLNVCEALFPLLRQDAQVVNVSSSAGHLSRIPGEHLRSQLKRIDVSIQYMNDLMKKFVSDAANNRNKQEGWGQSAYVVSKVGLSAVTRIQQTIFDREQPNRNVSVNSVHPGFVDTDMTSHKGVWTIDQGAAAPLYLALEPHGLKGKFVWSNAEVVDWESALGICVGNIL